jgi:glycosyltransferase involved in cell wall biosynthesis
MLAHQSGLERPERRTPPGDAPTVSIGLPVHNGEPFLRETLEALLAQTFDDFELVICDNASTDRTGEICAEFAERDPRIRYQRSPENVGAARNYNRTFELARGRYFRWSAADDLVEPDALEQCVAFLDANPDFVLAYPRTRIIDEAGRVIADYDDDLDVRHATPRSRAKHVLKRTKECNAVFGLIVADRLRKTRQIGTYVGSDHILLLELAFQGPFAELPDTVFYRRVHPGASSSDKSVARQREFYDPERSDRTFEHSCLMRTWRHFKESVFAVLRAPIGPGQKLRCLWFVLRRGVASRRHILAEIRRAKRVEKDRR